MECLWRMSFKWKRVRPLITMKSNSSQIKFFYGVHIGVRRSNLFKPLHKGFLLVVCTLQVYHVNILKLFLCQKKGHIHVVIKWPAAQGIVHVLLVVMAGFYKGWSQQEGGEKDWCTTIFENQWTRI
ncbi:hypothetical protein HanRHA438_Chr15g0718551 [Helianthus annuus]|nr:hypothetical protein HanOQP8_Chr15g0583271 [Helianthus annuus]KAJ0845873.1 hypothetical protein HanRHA438_Chr15g0718551 [Helianthus annuus]